MYRRSARGRRTSRRQPSAASAFMASAAGVGCRRRSRGRCRRGGGRRRGCRCGGGRGFFAAGGQADRQESGNQKRTIHGFSFNLRVDMNRVSMMNLAQLWPTDALASQGCNCSLIRTSFPARRRLQTNGGRRHRRRRGFPDFVEALDQQTGRRNVADRRHAAHVRVMKTVHETRVVGDGKWIVDAPRRRQRLMDRKSVS